MPYEIRVDIFEKIYHLPDGEKIHTYGYEIKNGRCKESSWGFTDIDDVRKYLKKVVESGQIAPWVQDEHRDIYDEWEEYSTADILIDGHLLEGVSSEVEKS